MGCFLALWRCSCELGNKTDSRTRRRRLRLAKSPILAANVLQEDEYESMEKSPVVARRNLPLLESARLFRVDGRGRSLLVADHALSNHLAMELAVRCCRPAVAQCVVGTGAKTRPCLGVDLHGRSLRRILYHRRNTLVVGNREGRLRNCDSTMRSCPAV
jgi:hypothetical protein